MSLVLFSDFPIETLRDVKATIWDIASYAISPLGYKTVFTKKDKLAEQVGGAIALVVFPGVAEDGAAVRIARARGIPIISIHTTVYHSAIEILTRELGKIKEGQ